MARPIKQGIDYFPLDCDFLSDEKVIAVNVNFGAKGVATLVALLCAIYRNGYYAQWNDILRLKVAGQLQGVSEDMVTKVVEICLKYGFFDKSLFESDQILTSKAIQQRYFSAVKRRINVNGNPHLLVSVCNNSVSVCNNSVSVCNNPIKEKKSKEKVSLARDIPPAREDGFLERFFQKSNSGGIQSLMAELGMPPDDTQRLRQLAETVLAEWRLAETTHQDYTDWASHLISTIRIKMADRQRRAKAPPPTAPKAIPSYYREMASDDDTPPPPPEELARRHRRLREIMAGKTPTDNN